jgi:phospholipid/cholesterol/gamma-HCH transport system substrate-binding protein
MDESKLRFGVGVLVIAAIGIGIILVFLFGAFPTVLNRDYMLFVDFPSAEGVHVNTPVYRDGVKVGRVSDIKLIADNGKRQANDNGVRLTLSMDSNYVITHRYLPRIGAGSLITGDAVVEFVVGNEEALARNFGGNFDMIPKPYMDEESISYGEKAADPMNMFINMEDDILRTLQKIQAAGDAVERVGNSVEKLGPRVGEVIENTDTTISDLSREAVETLNEFQGAIRDVRAIVGNPELRKSFESSIAKLPGLLDEAQSTLQSTQGTFQSFQRVGDRFEKVGEEAQKTVASVQKTIDNVERFTKPLGDRSEELVAQVLTSLANLDSALIQIDTFGKALNNSDGTVRRLLEDDELYWQIQRTVENVELATARIRPILDDVRVFTDKVARDPRELGVRGALTKRPSGAGLK